MAWALAGSAQEDGHTVTPGPALTMRVIMSSESGGTLPRWAYGDADRD
jgi:hypothetical protein